ncbi:hypothetical protein CAFE_17630 [Caprobacter fermentans]|uniref:Uncharacterized protein n=1 Tax=Caproicibacter fermentans TaxID=2576756 RepID=A0A6N8HYY4_9FIRM|nr:hypothetical protein [Caproicibacter fermentans]MVB11061.1 hypothetical protein [Caproicibacter fermentans]
MKNNDYLKGNRQNRWEIHYCKHIDVLIVRNGFGETVGVYDAKQLAEKWFAAGSDMFFALYGFNWIPPVWMQDRVRGGRKGRGRYGS